MTENLKNEYSKMAEFELLSSQEAELIRLRELHSKLQMQYECLYRNLTDCKKTLDTVLQ